RFLFYLLSLPVSLSAPVSGIWVKHRVTKTDSEIGSDRR
ncbi:unnamed protein product, partial [marine sediment metagenome]